MQSSFNPVFSLEASKPRYLVATVRCFREGLPAVPGHGFSDAS